MKKIIFLFCILLLNFNSFSQTALDEYYAIWEDESLTDSERVSAFKNYIWNGFLFRQPDSAFHLAEQLISSSQEKEYFMGEAMGIELRGMCRFFMGDPTRALEDMYNALDIFKGLDAQKNAASVYIGLGNMHRSQGDFAKAVSSYTQASNINAELGENIQQANAIGNAGLVYYDRGDFPRALDHFTRTLNIYEKYGDSTEFAWPLLNIGLIYQAQGEDSTGLKYFSKSLKIYEDIGDQSGIANVLGNIGINYLRQGEYDKALEHFQRTLSIHESIGDQRKLMITYNNIGRVHYLQDNYEQALIFFSKSLKLKEQFGDRSGIATNFLNFGHIYKRQGKYRQAIKYCKQGLKIAEELRVYVTQQDLCTCLYESYRAINNGSEALIYLEKRNAIRDSLNAEETNKKLLQMEFQKQILADSLAQVEKDRQVNLAHQEAIRKKNRTRNILIFSGLFVLLLAGGFFSRWRYIKKSRDIISKEKDRSENLLLNILPAEIAEELKEKGRADARDFDLVSILFTDFKDFTEASAQLSAQELVSEINTCFEAFDAIMAKYKIEKIKTIGDAYMAAGGLPVQTDDSIKNTVLAALDMQEFIIERKKDMKAKGLPAFEMRVGIHTGPVVAGIVGVKKFQYDIWGDTVNTASRMESQGEVGHVNISQTTYEHLKEDPTFSFESRGHIHAKGKGEIKMYFVRLS